MGRRSNKTPEERRDENDVLYHRIDSKKGGMLHPDSAGTAKYREAYFAGTLPPVTGETVPRSAERTRQAQARIDARKAGQPLPEFPAPAAPAAAPAASAPATSAGPRSSSAFFQSRLGHFEAGHKRPDVTAQSSLF